MKKIKDIFELSKILYENQDNKKKFYNKKCDFNNNNKDNQDNNSSNTIGSTEFLPDITIIYIICIIVFNIINPLII